MDNRTLWLHVGAPRTGTSSIQEMLFENRQALEENGVLNLTTANKFSPNSLMHAIRRGNPERIEKFSNQIRAQIREDFRTYIFSSEFLFGKRLKILFDSVPELQNFDVKVIMYLRRQDKYLESSYAQLAKSRHLGSLEDFASSKGFHGPNYDGVIDLYESNKIPVLPIVYEKERLLKGDVTMDFLSRIGLSDLLQKIRRPERTNKSPSAKIIELYQDFLAAGKEPISRKMFDKHLSGLKGPPPRLSIEHRQRIMKNAEASNERVRSRFFPERSTLFDLLEEPNQHSSSIDKNPHLDEGFYQRVAKVFAA